jgi:large repetitive protein
MKRATKRYIGLDALESRLLLSVTDSSGPLAAAVPTEAIPAITLTVDPASIDENQSLTLHGTIAGTGVLADHNLTIQWGDGGSTVLSLIAGQTSFSAPHQYLNDPVGPGTQFTIDVAVADADPGTGTASIFATVLNVAPVMTTLDIAPLVIDENGSATLAGAFTDPGTLDTHTLDIVWGDGTDQTVALAAGVLNFSVNHQYLDDNPTGTPSDTYTINATVTDDDAAQSAMSTTITVNNVPPVITALTSSAPGVGDAKENQLMTISGAFTDVGTLDTHTAVIDWGDGTTGPGTIVESGGAGTFSGSHAYATGGIYAIHVTVTDDDTGSATAATTAVITGVGIHNGVLQVIGTHQADHVSINRQGNGTVKVHANFLSDRGKTRTLDFSSVQRIEVLLGDGNDKAQVAGNITQTLVLDGGAGNDMLKAGGGPAVLIGGAGNDKLIGSKVRDILIGGTGVDMLVGGPGDDALIGGRTLFDPNDNALTPDFDVALLALLSEWNSGRDVATRVANLSGTGSGTRLNGDNFLQTGVTVLDIQKGDKLVGASGDNWYVDLPSTKSKGAAVAGKSTPADPKNNNNAPVLVTVPAPTTPSSGPGNSGNAPGKNK